MARDNDDDNLQEQVESMADRLKLKGKQRSKYIHEHMLQGGYRAEPHYVRDEEEDEDEGSGFFGRRRSRDDDTGSRRNRDDSGSSFF